MNNPLKSFIKDVKAIPTGVKLITFVIFLRTFGWGFVDPYFSIFIDSFGDNYTIVGFFVSLMSFISLLVVIPLMRLADKVKDSRIMQDGEIFYFFTLICYTAAGIFQSVPILICALILNGIAHPFVIVGAEAYIRKHSGKIGTTSTFSYYTALDYFGWIIGMILAAFLIDYYTFNMMFLFVLPSVIAALFILPRIHERGLTSFVRGIKRYFYKVQDFRDIVDDMKSLNKGMIFYLFLAFFDGVITMFKYIFIPLFALSIDLNFKQIALLMAIMYLPFVFSFFLSEVTTSLKKRNVIAFGLFIGAMSYVLLSFVVGQLWVVILAVITSFSLAIIRPAYNGIITHMTPRRMLGEISGLNNLMIRLGHITGPILSGVIADIYGIQVAFFIIAIFSLGLGVITLLIKGYESAIPETLSSNN